MGGEGCSFSMVRPNEGSRIRQKTKAIGIVQVLLQYPRQGSQQDKDDKTASLHRVRRRRGHFNFRFDGVRDEALFVGEMVEVFEFGSGGALVAGVSDPGIQGDVAHPRNTTFVFGHRSNGCVMVFFNLKALAIRNEEKGEHVTARDGGDECFFRVDVGCVGPGKWDAGGRRRSGDGHAAIKRPGVFAGVFALQEVVARAVFPGDGRGV